MELFINLITVYCIRTFGAILVLVNQLRNAESKVHVAVLGTMKNLSYGRANDENKMVIVAEKGLEELMNLLKATHVPEVTYNQLLHF